MQEAEKQKEQRKKEELEKESKKESKKEPEKESKEELKKHKLYVLCASATGGLATATAQTTLLYTPNKEIGASNIYFFCRHLHWWFCIQVLLKTLHACTAHLLNVETISDHRC